MTGKDRCLLGILMTVAVVVSVDDSIAINSRCFHRKDVAVGDSSWKNGWRGAFFGSVRQLGKEQIDTFSNTCF
jgi:hypothetical protein